MCRTLKMTEGGNPQELLKKKKKQQIKKKNPTLCYKEEFPFGQNAKQLCQKWYYLGVSSYRTCYLFNPAFPIRRTRAALGDPQQWGVLRKGGPTFGNKGNPHIRAGLRILGKSRVWTCRVWIYFFFHLVGERSPVWLPWMRPSVCLSGNNSVNFSPLWQRRQGWQDTELLQVFWE